MDSGAGFTRFKSHLVVVDITNPASPSVIIRWSISPTGGAQTFNSVVGGGGSTDTIAWGFYANDGDPCDTSFKIKRSSIYGLLFGTWTLGVPGSGFPVVVSNRSSGMGDYVGAVRRGLVSGNPFITWSQPVVTTPSCLPCNGSNYSLEVKGAEVLP